MLTETHKVAIRRHLGYSIRGDASVANFGQQYFTIFGQLEFRLTHLATEEERLLTGSSPPVDPKYTDEDGNTYYGYIAILDFLHSSIAKTVESVDIKKAGDYEANPLELKQRKSLYNYFRTSLGQFLGLPLGNNSSNLWVA